MIDCYCIFAGVTDPLSIPIGTKDTHIHASQYPNAGIFGRTTLLTWLNTYTFPLESSLSDLQTARRAYTRCVNRTLSHGTTTAAYFATTHVPATNLLADICLAKGQRAFVGRVCMDSDLSPEYYRDQSPSQAVKDTETTIEYMLEIDPERETICPIVTPRFAPSCSSELLEGLGAVAKKRNLPIQTHISENLSECELVRSLFPAQEHYAGVYDAARLLTPKTVLAHAVHLSTAEQQLLKDRGSGVSHCPASNTSLSSGLCPVRELLDQGIPVGLGTDVSGGYSSSILVAAREAGMVSRTRAALHKNEDVEEATSLAQGASIAADVVGRLMDKIGLEKKQDDDNDTDMKKKEVKSNDMTGLPIETGDLPVSSSAAAAATAAGADKSTIPPADSADRKKLTVEECLYLATMGGAKCLSLDHKIGSFAIGKHWDAQLVEVDAVPESESESKTKSDEHTTAAAAAAAGDLGLVEVWGSESWEDKIAKWVVCGDDRNTRYVFVRGRLVHQRRG